MNAVIDLRQVALNVPAKLLALYFLEALKLLDKIEFKLNRNPGCKLKGYILMGIGAAIAPFFRNNADCVCFFDPLPRR
jgi:hypothetical protein